jgi:hypothetical protein
VLQTFFSEEYQIMERGTFEDYRFYNLYQALNNARCNFYEIKCVVKHLKIEQCRCEHRESIDFMFILYTGEM